MTQESGTAWLTLQVSQRDHRQGPEAAPVTVVEYGDYECPYCGEAYPIVKEIQRRLGDRLRFVFRNFPEWCTQWREWHTDLLHQWGTSR